MKLYIGNLPWSLDEKDLKELFASYGAEEVTIIKDKYSGRSKGFGFVTISDEESAKKAISELDKKDIEGRALTVSEARPMVPRDGNRNSSESQPTSEAPEADSDAVNDAVEDSIEAETEETEKPAEAEAEGPQTVDEAVEDAKTE